MAKLTRKQEREYLEKRIKKGIGSYKVGKFKRGKKEYIFFQKKNGNFVTYFENTIESRHLMRINSKRVITEGRIKGFRKPQLFTISFYSQEQANFSGKQLRAGLVPIQKDRNKRDVDLLFDKSKYEPMSKIKHTS